MIERVKVRNALCMPCLIRLSIHGQLQLVRAKSTRSAINRGLAATTKLAQQPPRELYGRQRSKQAPKAWDGKTQRPSSSQRRQRNTFTHHQQPSPIESNPEKPRGRSSTRRQSNVEHNHGLESEETHQIPPSIPRTTAASQFLYGTNVVLAALRARRRNLYRLYMLPRSPGGARTLDNGDGRPFGISDTSNEIAALAKSAKVPLLTKHSAVLLDKMSNSRPHNGIVLEASTIPAPPVLSLGRPDPRKSTIPIALDRQSAEDAAVNGTPSAIPTSTESWRHPLIVMLDGITDPENVGSILRSCHFYGVDAVAIATNTCAPLSSPILAKASSGASEAVQLLALPRPSDFVYTSAKSGWEIHAAVAPAHSPAPADELSLWRTTAAVAAASPLAQNPCIIMLGSEGQGLRENLRRRANILVTIERGQGPGEAPDVGVDSMNVGVAAGVLLEAYMRKPASAPTKKDITSDLGW